ncbi:hypothetical protein KJ830_09920 [bacterium]|nr:hypothetical protein [bacterium]
MELFLQMGHQMKPHSLELLSKWGEGTVILSPKYMTLKQMKIIANDIQQRNGSVLVDPQFYMPRTSQEKLHLHSFWPQEYNTNTFFNGRGVKEMINILLNEYIYPLEASAFIIPTLYLENTNEDWNNITERTISSLSNFQLSIPKYLTVCVGEELLKNEENTHLLIEQLENYPVNGFYIIPTHPNNSYLVENVSWLLNLLDLVSSLKLSGKKVIVGYSNHQLLFLSLAKVDAICAGSWLKTRMFPLGDFNENSDEQGGGRRSIWYYCPQALSEYQVHYLDIAHRVGILQDMKPPEVYESEYSAILFNGAQPTTVDFKEKQAFRHYLNSLKTQCLEIPKETYGDTKSYLKMIFETAIDLTNYFRENGVRGKHRDFNNIGESNLSILDAFDNIRGLIYNAKWQEI